MRHLLLLLTFVLLHAHSLDTPVKLAQDVGTDVIYLSPHADVNEQRRMQVKQEFLDAWHGKTNSFC